jgi:hypothetical protein
VPEPVVAELVRAGLSRSTVLTMGAWKAQEVLDLLHSGHAGEGHQRAAGWAARAPLPGAPSPGPGPLLGFSTQD